MLCIAISLANLLQIALQITGQWVTDYELINPISGRGVVFHIDFGCLEGGGVGVEREEISRYSTYREK